LIYPHKLVIGQQRRDDLNRGAYKLNVSFTLPPGSYATLVVKRLFHFAWLEREESEEDGPMAGTAARGWKGLRPATGHSRRAVQAGKQVNLRRKPSRRE
jgi:hypothetical protein